MTPKASTLLLCCSLSTLMALSNALQSSLGTADGPLGDLRTPNCATTTPTDDASAVAVAHCHRRSKQPRNCSTADVGGGLKSTPKVAQVSFLCTAFHLVDRTGCDGELTWCSLQPTKGTLTYNHCHQHPLVLSYNLSSSSIAIMRPTVSTFSGKFEDSKILKTATPLKTENRLCKRLMANV